VKVSKRLLLLNVRTVNFKIVIELVEHPLCSMGSMTCLSLAIIDQCFVTCTRPRWQQWCNIKLAHRLIGIIVIIWSLHGIPYLIFYDHSISPLTNQTICQITNAKFKENYIGSVRFGFKIFQFISAGFEKNTNRSHLCYL
jgi:hypothetical protein